MAKRGRPSSYTPELGDEICRRLSGGESLRSICRDSDKPALSTVLLWVVDQKHQEFSSQYRAAREAAGYAHADQITELANELRNGNLDPQVAREIRGCLVWAAERMSPKAHSPRQEVTGAEGAPLNISIVRYAEDDDDASEDG